MSLIELREGSRIYEIGGTIATASERVNLEVESGALAVVLGPSGCGKTALLNLIGALDVATAGEAIIDGHHIVGASRAELARFRRETVSFVFQTVNLFPALTRWRTFSSGWT